MKSKERVLRAISRQETDRVPFDFTSAPSVMIRLQEHLRLASEEDVLRYLNIDLRPVWSGGYTGPQMFTPDGQTANCWGVVGDGLSYAEDLGYRPLQHVESVDEVYAHKWPNPDDFDYSPIEPQCDKHAEYATRGSGWCPIFCLACDMCGMETMLCLLAGEPEIADAILDCITDVYLGMNKRIFEAANHKLDICFMGDDYGGQQGMMINPDTWRKLIKPHLRRLYTQAKEYGLVTMHHSCGGIVPIIPDLIEIGVDALNPIQVRAVGMDPAFLKSEFGSRLAFHGAIDTQQTLPFGSENDVRNEVRECIDILGKGGGYILNGSHDYLEDIPTVNILAVFSEAMKSECRG